MRRAYRRSFIQRVPSVPAPSIDFLFSTRYSPVFTATRVYRCDRTRRHHPLRVDSKMCERGIDARVFQFSTLASNRFEKKSQTIERKFCALYYTLISLNAG